MQYLLTQAEYENMREAAKVLEREVTNRLQRVCTVAAERVPITLSWGQWAERPLPWGCVLTRSAEYCDYCPVVNECPSKEKEFSK